MAPKLRRLGLRLGSRRGLGTLHSRGVGYLGCLGHGDWAAREALEELLDDSSRAVHLGGGKGPGVIGAGWAHSAAVTPSGQVLLWGRTMDPPTTALMLSRANYFSPRLARCVNALSVAFDVGRNIALVPSVQAIAKVRRVACGAGTTIAIDADGRAHAAGCNDHGQCGVGTEHVKLAAVSTFLPMKFPEAAAVVDVALGFRHGVAVDDTGTVWGWGKNDNGQVGAGVPDKASDLRVDAPVEIALPPGGTKAVAVAAGLAHSAALTENGEVFVWGKMRGEKFRSVKNRKVFGEQVGPPVIYEDAFEPRELRFPPGTPPRVAVAASNFHTVALDERGDVWAVGLERDSRAMVVEPRRLIGLHDDDDDDGGEGLKLAIRSGIDAVAVFNSSHDVTRPTRNVYQPSLKGGACVAEPLLAVPDNTRLTDVAVGWKHTLALLDTEGGR